MEAGRNLQERDILYYHFCKKGICQKHKKNNKDMTRNLNPFRLNISCF